MVNPNRLNTALWIRKIRKKNQTLNRASSLAKNAKASAKKLMWKSIVGKPAASVNHLGSRGNSGRPGMK